MAHEKLYTPKQAAQSVLDKVGAILQKSELIKSHKVGTAVPGKCPSCGHPTPESGQGDTLPRTKTQENWMEKAEPKGEIHPKEPQAGESEKPGARIQAQKDPQHNVKEQAEGNNELAGTTPTQVGQDGKNIPGQDEMKGHLKLAKFIGMKHYKRTKSIDDSQAQTEAQTQHTESIGNK
jgi:hypothetical protein